MTNDPFANKSILLEACARAAHEANRAYCLALGDTSQAPWESAPEWQKSSARLGVEGALKGNTPEQSHAGWLEEKRRTGWRYGPIKDAEQKTHPCFVPYAELPEAQRAKDDLFLATVRAMAKALRGTLVSAEASPSSFHVMSPGPWDSKPTMR